MIDSAKLNKFKYLTNFFFQLIKTLIRFEGKKHGFWGLCYINSKHLFKNNKRN